MGHRSEGDMLLCEEGTVKNAAPRINLRGLFRNRLETRLLQSGACLMQAPCVAGNSLFYRAVCWACTSMTTEEAAVMNAITCMLLLCFTIHCLSLDAFLSVAICM